MEDSVKKILKDKLRKFLLPDFTNKLTWLFGMTGVSLIAAPTILNITGKASLHIYGINIDLDILSQNTTTPGIILCIFALVQNITYHIYKIAPEIYHSKKEVDYVKKEIDILEQKNEYLEAISAVNVVSQIKAMKELHEMEVTKLRSEIDNLRVDVNNDATIKELELKVQQKEDEISSIKATLKMMSNEKAVTIGNEFVFGSIPFEYKGEKYLAAVFNNIHMHFPLKHILSVLDKVSTNPNSELSTHWENEKYVLTLNNEGSFKMSITESELASLRAKISDIDTNPIA